MVTVMWVKKTYSFSEENIARLEHLIPKSKRSRFINSALTKAIAEQTKTNALKMLEDFERIQADGKSITETLREVRQSESNRLSR